MPTNQLRILLKSCLMAMGLSWAWHAHGQLVINEVCSKNTALLADGHGRTPDWIELHNAGNVPVQLNDYHLSDRVQRRDMWRLPEGELPPGAFLVLFAAHSESGPGHFPFGLAQQGEGVYLSGPELQPVDEVVVPFLQADHSYGRHGGGWAFFAQPTPGMANTTAAYPGYAQRPVPELPPGHYATGTVLYINAEEGAVVRTTLDGRPPGTGSPAYAGSIALTNTMVVRAQAEKPGWLPSEVMTATYLIDEPRHLPVVSICVEPDSLFDEVTGLFMPGPDADSLAPFHGANFWSKRQVPVHFEFMEDRGEGRFSQLVDLRVHGGSQARSSPQLPFRLTARKRHGSSTMDFPFFPENGRMTSYKHLVLRNSGGDFAKAHFRDGFWHRMARDHDLDIDALGYRPTMVYINGEYWGILNLRERTSAHHVANHYGIDRKQVLMMENENLSRVGDTIHFAQLRDYILAHDMNDPEHFAQVQDQLDLPSFKDYVALEMFAGNADWPANNVRY